jgi:hypothetical protein
MVCKKSLLTKFARGKDLYKEIGKQWKQTKTQFRPGMASGRKTFEERQVERQAYAAMKAREKEMKDEKIQKKKVCGDCAIGDVENVLTVTRNLARSLRRDGRRRRRRRDTRSSRPRCTRRRSTDSSGGRKETRPSRSGRRSTRGQREEIKVVRICMLLGILDTTIIMKTL